MNSSLLIARPRHYGALFLMAMSVILWEILLTRIYSVLLYYHFAFMAVSIAMFGLALGAAGVILRDVQSSAPELPTDRDIASLALATGLLMALTMTLQLCLIPSMLQGTISLMGILFRTYVLSTLPFIPAGAFTCILLTRSTHVNKLYAVDLLGAALGCALVPWLLSTFGGPGATIVTAGLACSASIFLLGPSKRARWISILCSLGLFLFAGLNIQTKLLRIRWRHDGPMPPPLFERWNAFSRIMVMPSRSGNEGWGIEDFWRNRFSPVPQLELEIDSGAGTAMTFFDGRLEPIRYLRYDITSFVHYLRPQSKVLIIGPGGGRDVLTALSFYQPSVRAVEVNPSIVQAVNGAFGDFTGHLDRRPDVQFIVDEGRSYVRKTPDRFDIIQASLVDTVAATAAGAYSFVENGLYTVEGWRLFLSRLSPRGVLSFSRWYYGSTTWPVEVSRIVSLAAEALRQEGLNPRDHVMVIRNSHLRPPKEGIATILTSPSPFSPEDRLLAEATCRELKCEVALADGKGDPLLAAIVNTVDPASLYRELPLDISPPTDDKPYFFFHARLSDVLSRRESPQFGGSAFNLPAVRILLELTVITLVLSILLIAWPYNVLKKRNLWKERAWPLSLGMACYFGLIGAAFMFLEISWMQRFSLFLGHPTYGFTVILFGLLLATGAGSWAVSAVKAVGQERWLPLAPLLLVPCLALTDFLGRPLLIHAAGAALSLRIFMTLSLISIPAFFMGIYFPIGMDLALKAAAERAEWFWAINGALSVLGSVLAMVSSLAFGISGTLWMGAGFYLAAAGWLIFINSAMIL